MPIRDFQIEMDWEGRTDKTVDVEVTWSAERSFWNCPKQVVIHKVEVVEGDERFPLPDCMIPMRGIIDVIQTEEIDLMEISRAEERAAE